MTPINIHTTLTSDTPHLPELGPLVGRAVEIVVTEAPPPDADVRAEIRAMVDPIPQTAEEYAAQQATARAWAANPRYAAFKTYLEEVYGWDYDGFLDHLEKHEVAQAAVLRLRERGTYDYDAQAVQDAIDMAEMRRWIDEMNAVEPPS